MTTAQRLGETSHVSPLLRRARCLGLGDIDALIGLAVQRGSTHYQTCGTEVRDPGRAAISNEELVVLLLLGEHRFQPLAIRCAAQLVAKVDLPRLEMAAKRERASRILCYIAGAGEAHDTERRDYWRTLRARLGNQQEIAPGLLPHWSRFVSDPGQTRGQRKPAVWLAAR